MEKTLIDILVSEFDMDASEITPDTSLTDDLAMDSLEIMELLMALEKKLGITIPAEDIAELKTVAQVAAYLEGRKA
ncbi:MAG: acyl carrier protein [Clostridiales bacterium]|nr:acyl carrier protein [Clostridiales bacterium]